MQAVKFSYYSLIVFVYCNTVNRFLCLIKRTITESEIQHNLMPFGQALHSPTGKPWDSVNVYSSQNSFRRKPKNYLARVKSSEFFSPWITATKIYFFGKPKTKLVLVY